MAISTEISKKELFLKGFANEEHRGNSEHTQRIFEEAKSAVQELDFPTRKTEKWKYTSVNKIVDSTFNFQKCEDAIDIKPFLIPNLEANVLVFVNGYFRKDLSQTSSTSEDLVCMPMSMAIEQMTADFEKGYGSLSAHKTDIFSALNTAHATDGAFVLARKNTNGNPIHILNLTSGESVLSQCRNLFIAEQGSKLDIIESCHSLDGKKAFSNSLSEIVCKENAHLSISKIQEESSENFLLTSAFAQQESNSTLSINTITKSGGWVRNNTHVLVDGENCETNLYGAYMPHNKEHVDNHTIVDHLKPHCESNELYKGVIYDSATGVFNGKVFVRQAAQKTNAFQQNANILMSDSATMDSKPELEIYADDVKCSHGSTTGQFDEEALFYLMQRGISEDQARNMLVSAFVSEVIEKIGIAEVRLFLEG